MSMPPFNLPLLQAQQQRPTHCHQDGFPLVEIDGELYCSVEYADSVLGGQKVVGVAERRDDLPQTADGVPLAESLITLLFASDWELPLTCPCCGGALHLRPGTVRTVRQLLIGRTLEGFRHGEWVGKGGNGVPPKRHPVFALQFSGNEERAQRTIEVSLESLRLMRERDGARG